MSGLHTTLQEDTPVLLYFFAHWQQEDTAQINAVLRDTAAALGGAAVVLKINIEQNKALTKGLRIVEVPTFIVYAGQEMVWRTSGFVSANILISVLKKYT